MFVDYKQDATSVAQSGALYAPQNPISQWVPPGTNKCILCTPKPDLTTCSSWQRNRAKPPRNLVLGLKKWIGQVRCEKTRRNFGSIKWCIVCTPKPDLTTGTS